MTIHVSRLPDEAIIVATFEPPLNLHEEIPWMFQKFLELRDTIENSRIYYVVIDTATSRGAKYNFGEVVFILGEARTASRQKRPDMEARLMLVGGGVLIDMAAKAMAQLQYGSYAMRMYATVEDALSTARAELANAVAESA
jgi:hypothetical protein